MKIKLETSDGLLVGYTVIPEFKMLPDVVMWGTRHFKIHEVLISAEEPQELGTPIYRECFTAIVLNPVSGEAMNNDAA